MTGNLKSKDEPLLTIHLKAPSLVSGDVVWCHPMRILGLDPKHNTENKIGDLVWGTDPPSPEKKYARKIEEVYV